VLSAPKKDGLTGGLISIFQEPLTSLNPVYTCGEQVVEVFCSIKQFLVRKLTEGDRTV